MKMESQQFRIGRLSQELNVPKFVIRFWEKEFAIKSSRTEGGQRYYTTTDFLTFKKIKDLLYTRKFTIAGAKKALHSPSIQTPLPTPHQPQRSCTCSKNTISQDLLLQLRDTLYRLQRML